MGHTPHEGPVDRGEGLRARVALEVPGWVEGSVLPPFASQALDPERQIACMRGKGIEPGQPFSKGSAMLVKGRYKLACVFGYSNNPENGNVESLELYDLESDPEELNDLYPTQKALGESLLAELFASRDNADRRYLGG